MEETTPKHSISLTGFLVAFFGALLFSTKAIIVKKAFVDVHADALTLLTLRMLFSLPFYLVAAFLVSSNKSNKRMTPREWLIVILLGTSGYYLSSLLDFLGLQYISAGLERLILFLYPSFVVLINAFLFKEKIKGIIIWALILSYLGIAVAYFGELQIEAGNPNFYWGSFLILLCSVTFAIYIAGSGYIIPKVGASKFTAYALLCSTAGVFIHYILRGDYGSVKSSMNLWWYGILLALIATVIPTFMLSFALKKIGASNVAIISSIGPVSTILQAHLVLGEPIFAEQILGTAMVLAGILLLSIKPRKASEEIAIPNTEIAEVKE
jgi:drug/metabolite transporter (DMT)-like permease